MDVWDEMHDQHDWKRAFPLVRIQVERLPNARRKPDPVWLAWPGREPLPDTLDYRRRYKRRLTVEHAIRFAKHDLG